MLSIFRMDKQDYIFFFFWWGRNICSAEKKIADLSKNLFEMRTQYKLQNNCFQQWQKYKLIFFFPNASWLISRCNSSKFIDFCKKIKAKFSNCWKLDTLVLFFFLVFSFCLESKLNWNILWWILPKVCSVLWYFSSVSKFSLLIFLKCLSTLLH